MFTQTLDNKTRSTQWRAHLQTEHQQSQRYAHNVAFQLSRKHENLSDPHYYKRWFMYFITGVEHPYNLVTE